MTQYIIYYIIHDTTIVSIGLHDDGAHAFKSVDTKEDS